MVERTLREAGVCVRQTFKGPPLKVSLQPGPTCEGPLTPQNSTAWDMGLSGMFHCHPITVLQLRSLPNRPSSGVGLGKGKVPRLNCSAARNLKPASSTSAHSRVSPRGVPFLNLHAHSCFSLASVATQTPTHHSVTDGLGPRGLASSRPLAVDAVLMEWWPSVLPTSMMTRMTAAEAMLPVSILCWPLS